MKDDINFVALVGLVIRAFTTGVILLYIVPKQFKEVLRPHDWLSGLRWRVLGLFLISVAGAIPALTYQTIRTFGNDNHLLRNVATIAGSISTLATTWLIVEVYKYRRKDR